MGTDLYFEPLYAEELVVLLPEGHPAGNNEHIHLKDLREHRLLITANNCTYRKKVEIAFQELPGSQMNTMEIGSMTALKNYVAAGLGVALIPKSIVSPPPPGTIVRFIGDDDQRNLRHPLQNRVFPAETSGRKALPIFETGTGRTEKTFRLMSEGLG
jgi:DNA-binding transcriptional LysR family regulator